MKIHFLGGAGTVTGSKFLVETRRARLLVDCGLFQGLKALRLRNRQPLPLQPSDLDAIVLTHAHIDHSGYLPVVVRDGFRGPIYATAPTRDLVRILLPDSGHLQEEDARYANKKKFSKHHPALPLYTEADAEHAAGRVQAIDRGAAIEIGDLTVRLGRAGHILGASTVVVESRGRTVVFSGDLGRADDLLMHPPEAPPPADVVIMESTYGDRRHPEGDPIEMIRPLVARVVERGGVLLVPSFAVGRAQMMLYCIHRLFEQGAVERVPVYVNSPMATDVTRLFRHHHAEHKLDAEQSAAVCADATFVGSVEESKELNRQRGPMIIISASGMLTGGRILHHLKEFGPDPKNAILLPGFQAAGTRGEALARGVDEIKVHGRYVPIRAEVQQLHAFSAHADRDGLLQWLAGSGREPEEVVLVHGEPAAADALRQRIEERFGCEVTIPALGDTMHVR